MGQTLFRAALMLCLSLSASAVVAEPASLYDCTVDVPGNRGWIPTRVVIGVKADEQAAMVYDGYIERIYGEPINARVEPRDEKSLYVYWTVENMRSSAQITLDAQYRAVLFKETQRVMLTAVLSFYDNYPRGSGRCTVQPREIAF